MRSRKNTAPSVVNELTVRVPVARIGICCTILAKLRSLTSLGAETVAALGIDPVAEVLLLTVVFRVILLPDRILTPPE
jgi:hypothetical protein